MCVPISSIRIYKHKCTFIHRIWHHRNTDLKYYELSNHMFSHGVCLPLCNPYSLVGSPLPCGHLVRKLEYGFKVGVRLPRWEGVQLPRWEYVSYSRLRCRTPTFDTPTFDTYYLPRGASGKEYTGCSVTEMCTCVSHVAL